MARTGFKVAQLANGTDGELITWDSSGNPTTVAVGTAGHVLTSNGAGAAPTFQAAAGGGSSSGIAGAVQFSGGSGAFSSDATNFFFDDSTNQLQMTGGTSYGIRIQGQNGGVDASAASSVTGAFIPFRSNTDATGTINVSITNSNTSSSTSHAALSLSTSTGGGDPFVKLTTAEVGYVVGVDNSGSDKFYIGLGTDPSTMSTSNITLTGSAMGVMQTSPTAKLHLGAGTASASTAPLKFTSGTAMTTPEDGALEYHTSHLYFTVGSTRYQLDQQAASVADGDKGDITVSSSGTVWTIDALAVTNAKINDVSFAKLTNGTLAANLTGTMVNSGVLAFNYNSGSSAVFLDDANSSASLFSEDGTQYVNVSNTSVAIGSGTTQMEYIDGVLRLYDSDQTQYIGIQTPSTGALTTSYTLILPTTDGNSGEALITNGSGTLSWSTVGSGDVTGPGSSVDNQIVLFNSTSGKVIKAATTSGIVTATSGAYGVVTAPSGTIVGNTDTQTLTNKRIDPRIASTTSNTAPAPDVSTTDIYIMTALAGNCTFGAPTGTPVQGTKLIYRVKDNGTARTLAYNAVYRAMGVTLPTTTVINKTLYLGCIYNSTDTKWDVVSVNMEA